MNTTVAVKEDTFALLKDVKEKTEAPSFDEVIKKLIMETKKPKKSLRGLAKNTPEFVREEIDRFA